MNLKTSWIFFMFTVFSSVLATLTALPVFAALQFDLNLVRPWNKTDKDGFPTPLVAAFHKSGKTLVFVGDHHNDPAKTYAYTAKAIDKYSPEIIVVEGLETSKGKDPKQWISRHIGKSKEEIWKDPSLGSGTELLATAHRISIIGGEPSIEEEMKSQFLLSKGFDHEDIRNVQILQRIPYRRDKMNMSDPELFFDFALKLYQVKESKSDFKPKFFKWYKKRAHAEFDYSKITKASTDVNCDSHDSFLQRAACAINIHRDRALVKQVETLLKSHNRVMVVYGTGHFVQEYPTYLRAFGGKPEYLSLEINELESKEKK